MVKKNPQGSQCKDFVIIIVRYENMSSLIKHKPIKKFGQNFLIDPWVIQQIINEINPIDNQMILEIGPGLGAITLGLLNSSVKLIAIEIDNNLFNSLTSKFAQQIATNKLILINQDILNIDLLALPINVISELRVVGNLPYNISTPLLFKMFTYSKQIKDMHFLLQKELAERLVAKPNNKKYGRLSVMAQYHANINIAFHVQAESFKPSPKVESSMVKINPFIELPYVAKNYVNFSQLVNSAFSKRRKILSNCLKEYCSDSHLRSVGVDPMLRPEQLEVADFVRISNSL